MKSQILREITPLKETDCFSVFDRRKNSFNFPIHFHPEFELSFVENAEGARRYVGDHIGIIGKVDLVLIGPDLIHCWEDYKNNTQEEMQEITIQFPRELFSDALLNRNILKPINDLFKNASRGILFPEETASRLAPKIKELAQKRGYESFLDILSLLYELAIAPNQQLLANRSFQIRTDYHNSKRIEDVYKYVVENFNSKMRLEDVAAKFNMTVISFTRLMKQHTGKSFVDFVNEIRLGYATRYLIETNKSIADICFECGFNNISNFNRIFKKHKDVTPSEFRENFNGTKIVL